MVSEISIHIAGILGPVLMVVSSSEFLNFKIWNNVAPTTVALNGMVLLICGIATIRFHNIWEPTWALIITVLGWLIFLAGAYRMYFPKGKQAGKSGATKVFLLSLFLLGLFLTFKGYLS